MITPLYAAFCGLIFLVLSFNVIGKRLKNKIGIGDGDNHDLAKAIRVHGNFAEYVPLCLILMLLLEMQGFSALLLHALGSILIIGRCLHAYGLQRTSLSSKPRALGMVMTHSVTLTASILLIAKFIENL